MNKEISFLNCFMGKSRGGIEVVTRDYAEALKKAGHKSELLTVSRKNYTDYILKSGLKTYLMCSRGLNPLTIAQFARHLFKSKPDIVFLHGTKAIEFGTCKLIKILFPSIKFVGVSHGVYSQKYKKLKYAVVVTPYLKKHLEQIGVPKVFCCPNMTSILNVEKKENEILTIGTSGRSSPAKGFDILLQALGILAEQKVSFRCLFAGCEEKDYQDLIDKYNLKEHVRFLGWINDKEKFYNSLDIYCSPSRREPFGLTIIEAMMAELPIVATKCAGPCYIVKPSFGILTDTENPKELAEGLKILSDNAALRKQMGAAARAEAVKCYNKENLPKHLRAIYNEIMAEI